MVTTFCLTLLSTLLMCTIPLALAAGLRRLYRVPWWLFLFGCATFIISQIIHLPLNHWLADRGWLNGSTTQNLPLWRNSLILGLSAGLCEGLTRTGGFTLLRKQRRFEDAAMIGLGHGGVEAMIIGGMLTLGTVTALMPLVGKNLATLGITREQIDAINRQLIIFSQPWFVFLPLLERLLAIGLHCTISVLLWQSFRSPARWWGIPLGIAYHAAVDGSIVFIVQYIHFLLVQGVLALLLLPGLIWVWKQFPVYRNERSLWTLTAEWHLFLAAVGKELLFAWRSQRLLVIFGVYVLFGLTSPLLAYYIPHIIAGIPEAAQLAASIPPPTVADAMLQYIKNVTQFGFILAILIGMGAIAGEKETGTAVMILSKPLPRWAFVLSKFTAQALVYLGAYLFTALGAAYYTWFLFGNLDVGNFAVLNGLLFVWLLPYIAMALLGSALGRSTGMAAGIGLAGSMLLMSAQALPRYGTLAPGTLIGWAQMLGTGKDPLQAAAEGGAALGITLIVTILACLGAVAAFEIQEL